MKKIICVLFCLLGSCLLISAENKTLKIKFTPYSGFELDTSFIENTEFSRYTDVVKSLEKARKAFSWEIPKTGIMEGEYHLLIYEDNTCIAAYDIVNDNYVYNKTRGCFQKIPNILDRVRAILFVEYLKSDKNISYF